jgi:5,10-methylene-tetrahydrofolate dehydrogenase/methenyl tetrahydrofolate cyclohydrolase
MFLRPVGRSLVGIWVAAARALTPTVARHLLRAITACVRTMMQCRAVVIDVGINRVEGKLVTGESWISC